MNDKYEMLWRPTFELRASIAWLVGVFVSTYILRHTTLPTGPFYYMIGIGLLMTFINLAQGLKHLTLKHSLQGKPLTFINEKQLKRIAKRLHNEVWLGYGFIWGHQQAQRVYEINKRMRADLFGSQKKRDSQMGSHWIHGVEPHESPIKIPLKHLEGHTIIFGTTGAGKTRLFDTLITQAVLRCEPVIVVDPKGDTDLRIAVQRACIIASRPDAFVHFHPAFASMSYSIDPLKNWNRPTEIASRIATLIKSEAGMDPFVSFSWMALNNIANGLILVYGKPNLITLRRYIEGGVETLLRQTFEVHFKRTMKDWETRIEPYLTRYKATQSTENTIKAYYAFYLKYFTDKYSSSEIEGLMSMYTHNRDHFSKMVASLLPVLNMLTSGPLRNLLSPASTNEESTSDIATNPKTDSSRMIENNQVVYMGLDALSDATISGAIGSIILADLTSVAGDRYNNNSSTRVNVFIDEASEVLNDSMIQMLNKGRGAGYLLTVATQSFSDFVAATGNADKARQVIANANNLITLRVKDGETQKFVTETFGKTVITQIMETQNTNAIGADRDPTNWSGGYGERRIEAEGELFPPDLLGSLPNLEYMGSVSGGKIIKGRIPILTSKINPTLNDMKWLKDRDRAAV